MNITHPHPGWTLAGGLFLAVGCALSHERPGPEEAAHPSDAALPLDAGQSPDAGMPPDTGLSCAPEHRCGMDCVDFANDPMHCGGCGIACGPGEMCDSGECGVTCGEGLEPCGGSCVDLRGDNEHCGACERACAPTEECIASACVRRCPPPRSECGGACVDVMEDVAHCGECGAACGADEVCTAGACEPMQSRIGWVTPLSNVEPGHPNFVVGIPLTVPTATTLTAVGLIAHDAGHRFRMALYRDEGGVPTELVASTGVRSTSAGPEEHAITPTSIAAGDYWLAGIYEERTNVGFQWEPDLDNAVHVHEWDFDEPFPEPLISVAYPDWTHGYLLNYWIVVSP